MADADFEMADINQRMGSMMTKTTPTTTNTNNANDAGSRVSKQERKQIALRDLPLPCVYTSISRATGHIESELPSSQSETVQFTITHPVHKRPVHLFLAIDGHQFTKEEILNANKQFPCYNCGRRFDGLIHFRITERTNSQTTYGCSPIPHCREACVARTVTDLKMNAAAKALHYEVYGGVEPVAPPRMLLYIRGGLTLEQYHQTIDNGLTIIEEEQKPNTHEVMIRSFPAPMYFSASMLKSGHLEHSQEVRSLVDLMDQLVEEKASMGMTSHHQPSELPVKPLSTPSLFQSDMGMPPHPVSQDVFIIS